jgi:hypothetical protein
VIALARKDDYIEGWKVVLGVGCAGFFALSIVSGVTGNPLWALGFFSASFIAGLILGVVLWGEYQQRAYQEEDARLQSIQTREQRIEHERRRRLEVMEQLRTMSDEDFGTLMRGILEQMGYQPQASGADPYELHLVKGDEIAYASWRNWREALTTDRVLQASESAARIGAKTAFVVTMGDVPPPAQNVAEARNVSIIATARLVALALDALEPLDATSPRGPLRFGEPPPQR